MAKTEKVSDGLLSDILRREEELVQAGQRREETLAALEQTPEWAAHQEAEKEHGRASRLLQLTRETVLLEYRLDPSRDVLARDGTIKRGARGDARSPEEQHLRGDAAEAEQDMLGGWRRGIGR